MNHNSTFKYIFFTLAALVLMLFFGLFFKSCAMLGGVHSPIMAMGRPLLLVLPVLALFVIAAFVAVYVYQDAKDKPEFFIPASLKALSGKNPGDGQRIFEGVCAACHGMDGQGLYHAFQPASGSAPFRSHLWL